MALYDGQKDWYDLFVPGSQIASGGLFSNPFEYLFPANNQQNTADALSHEELRQDSQYQRMVEDLRKAGLNPWLALQGGLGSAGSYATNPNQDDSMDIKSLIATLLMIMRIGKLAGA